MRTYFSAICKQGTAALVVACIFCSASCLGQTSTAVAPLHAPQEPEQVLKDDGWVGAIAFSPDSVLLASSGVPFGNIQLWDVHTGTVKRTISTKWRDTNIPIVALAFSPDGKTLAAGGGWHLGVGGVGLWDVGSGKFLRWLLDPGTDKHWANDVCYSRDGKWLAACFWLYGQKSPYAVRDLVLRPQDYPVVGQIEVWDAHTGKLVRSLHRTGQPKSVSFAPDNRTLAFCENATILWDVQTGKIVRRFTNRTPDAVADVDASKFSPDGSAIAGWVGVSDTAVRLWDARTGKLRHVLPIPEARPNAKTSTSVLHGIEAVDFSPDGKIIAGGEDRADPAVRLWDTATGTLLQVLNGHTERITAIAFSPDGMLIASGGRDRKICLWRMKLPKKREI